MRYALLRLPLGILRYSRQQLLPTVQGNGASGLSGISYVRISRRCGARVVSLVATCMRICARSGDSYQLILTRQSLGLFYSSESAHALHQLRI
jgi:hypothetical protein